MELFSPHPEPPANGAARRARETDILYATARAAGWFLSTVAERCPRTDGCAAEWSSLHVRQTMSMSSAAFFWGQAEQTHTSASGTGVLAIFYNASITRVVARELRQALGGNGAATVRLKEMERCCWLSNFFDSATFHFAELFLRSVEAFICLSAYLDICVAKKSQQKKGKNVGHNLKNKKPGTSAMFQCLYVFHLSAQRNHSLKESKNTGCLVIG